MEDHLKGWTHGEEQRDALVFQGLIEVLPWYTCLYHYIAIVLCRITKST